MKKIIIITYALWIVVAMGLKIVGIVGWWIATSWLWLPLAIAFTFLAVIFLAVSIGTWLKIREEKRTPDSCENCLFGVTSRYADEEKCLGEVLNEGSVKKGTICQHYKRYSTR